MKSFWFWEFWAGMSKNMSPGRVVCCGAFRVNFYCQLLFTNKPIGTVASGIKWMNCINGLFLLIFSDSVALYRKSNT